jgi:hypothetical protein
VKAPEAKPGLFGAVLAVTGKMTAALIYGKMFVAKLFVLGIVTLGAQAQSGPVLSANR